MRDVAKRGGAPGQITACIFGLKNAVPEEWRDVQHQQLEHTGTDSGPVKFELSAKARQHIEEVKSLLGLHPSAPPAAGAINGAANGAGNGC